MNKTPLMTLFAVVAVAQLAVPISMIVPREAALQSGTQYKFKCAPVDPFDAFRGRYVAIRLEATSAPAPSYSLDPGDTVYATIDRDAEGFAFFSQALRDRPPNTDYLKMVVHRRNGPRVVFVNPFDRYYMPEDLAPAAERAYWDANRGPANSTYLAVRIRNGTGVTEDLFIDNIPVREYIALHAQDGRR